MSERTAYRTRRFGARGALMLALIGWFARVSERVAAMLRGLRSADAPVSSHHHDPGSDHRRRSA